MLDNVFIKPRQGDCSAYQDVDLRVRVHFQSADKVYYGLPVIVAGQWPVSEVKKLTEIGVLCIINPDDPGVADFYENEETYRTIYPVKSLEAFKEFYDSVTDKTKIKYAMICLGGSQYHAEFQTGGFRQHFPSVVLFGTDLVDPYVSRKLDALDAVWYGNQTLAEIEPVTGVALDRPSDVIESLIAGDQRLIVDLPLKNPGEAAKALALGADFVVMGPAMSGDGYTVEMLLDGLRAACAFTGVDKLEDFYGSVYLGRRS